MTAQDLINNYLEAYQKLSEVRAAINEHKDVLKQDFKEKHPEYYIKDIFTTGSIITASVYETASDKIVTAFAYLSFDRDWKW